MNIIIKNRFPKVQELLRQHHTTLSIMGMPNSGISLLLRHLAAAEPNNAVYVDVFGLASLSASGLFRSIATAIEVQNPPTELPALVQSCIAKLEEHTAKHGNITIYLGGFDQMINAIDGELLQYLQALARSCQGKARIVFGLCTNLKKLIPDACFDSGLRVFGNKYYMGGYTTGELRYLLSVYGPKDWAGTPDLDAKISLSGGHLGLLMQLIDSKSEDISMRNEATNLLFYNMYQQLPGPQRTTVRNLALGKKQPLDEHLSSIGLVQNEKLFSPLFANYLQETNKERLPVKERRLFLLLKRNLGRVVSKDEIKDIVWQDEITGDWALNALVYRLRNHAAFKSQGYTIENHKKLGYALAKNR